jgi:biopolymer transport protein ExbD
MYFEKDPLEPALMTEKLTAALATEPGRRIVLRADRNARYGDVRKLFKTCQVIGFPGISLRVNEVKVVSKAQVR